MEKKDKFKIEVRLSKPTEIGRKVIPLPVEKVTGISWTELVSIIAENGVEIVETIRFHNVGQEGGTNMLTRNELLLLWKAVEGFRNKKPN